MVKEELIQRSPVRVLMKSIQDDLRKSPGLGPGELGLIASPSGIGKTSVLVQIALDRLLQGSKVIHVSFTRHSDNVLLWYSNIFDEFIRSNRDIQLNKKSAEDGQEIKNEIVKNRVLMKFNQDGITVAQIVRSLQAMIRDGCFAAENIIVDGYKFSPDDGENIGAFRNFAKELGLCIWFSCNVGTHCAPDEPLFDRKKIPFVINGYADKFDVIAVLEPKQEPSEPAHIALTISRKRGEVNPGQPALRLDPKTLLLLENPGFPHK